MEWAYTRQKVLLANYKFHLAIRDGICVTCKKAATMNAIANTF